MKKSILFAFTLLFLNLYSQEVLVVDKATQEPLSFATLYSQSLAIAVQTNEEGKADISSLKNANDISIQFIAYKNLLLSYAEIIERNYKIELQAKDLSLDEVVVAATKWEESGGNIPMKDVAITKKEMTFQQPQNAADLLAVSGKVFIQKSQQGGGSPMIRGFATNRLLYVVDGVRMNTAIFRGGNIQNVISLDGFATEKVEVVFGPGSVMYGSDAIGGVMQFQTLQAKYSPNDNPYIKGNAVLRYSSANQEKTGHFDVNLGWQKFAMLTSFSYSDFDHLRQGSNGPDEYVKPYYVQRIDSTDVVVEQDKPLLQVPTAYDQFNLMHKMAFKVNKYADLNYGFHYSVTSPYGRYDRHNRMRNDLPRYAVWDYGPQKWMMNQVDFTYSKPNLIMDKMKVNFAHQLFEESRIDRSFNKTELSEQVEKVNAYSVNLDFYKRINNQHKISYGAEYVLNKVASTGQITNINTEQIVDGPSRYPAANWHSIGVYVNDLYQLNSQLTFQAGLRYSHIILDAQFDTTFYPFPFTTAQINSGNVTGSLGAVYRPMEDFIIQANFGTAFRSPNIDDIGKVFDSEPGIVTVPNADLKPEYAYNIDVGLAKIFADRVKIDFTAYYTFLQNALVRRDFTLNGQDSILYDGVLSQVQAIQNAAKANVWGIQAGVEIKLPHNFSLSTDFNYQKGREELDDGSISPSRHAAPWFGNAKLKYKFQHLTMELAAIYSGGFFHDQLAVSERGKTEIYAKDDIGRTYSPGWYIFNLKADYQLHKNIAISAGIENLADVRYRPYSSGMSAPGRNFILAFRAQF